MNSNTTFAQVFARAIDESCEPLSKIEEMAAYKAKALADHEAAKAEMLEMRARVAIAIEKAETPADQIAVAEKVPLLLDTTSGRWTLAPYIEPPTPLLEIQSDWMLNNKLFQKRAARLAASS